MKNKFMVVLLPACILCSFFSCSPKNISSKYYFQHEKVLDRIEETYKALYPLGPFNIAFTDKGFKSFTLEIITDSLSYRYEFETGEPRLIDTLAKFGLSQKKIPELISQMQSIKCAWINSYDYYVDEKKNTLIFMSVKPVALQGLLSPKKYYILTYFRQPQYFDSEGRLLDKRKLRRLRKINGEVFRRINDKVCYTISGTFR